MDVSPFVLSFLNDYQLLKCEHYFSALDIASFPVLEVYFGEVDYREVEGTGVITASIIKEGLLMEDLYLNIIPLTYDEFDARGFELTPERRLDRPDPAECKLIDIF